MLLFLMAPRTRLDPVVKLQERREERSLQDMAAANRQAMAARQALELARDKAQQEHRQAGPVDLWALADLAHVHARNEVVAAEHAANTAQQTQGSTRTAYLSAHARAEALRRVASSRREAQVRDQERAESREVDDLQLMRRHGRTG